MFAFVGRGESTTSSENRTTIHFAKFGAGSCRRTASSYYKKSLSVAVVVGAQSLNAVVFVKLSSDVVHVVLKST